MHLEGLDDVLGGVALVDVWQDKTIHTVPALLNDASILSAGFVVGNLGGDCVPSRLDILHGGVVGGNVVFVLVGLECRLEAGVGVAVERYYDVLIATAGTNREPASTISVELFDRLHADVEFTGKVQVQDINRCR